MAYAIRQRERQGEMGHMACSSACVGWFRMMDDGSRACRTHLRTFRRCALVQGRVEWLLTGFRRLQECNYVWRYYQASYGGS